MPILSILISTGCGSVSGLSGITPAGDTTPPSVTSTTPAAEATVPADAAISVTFSEPMSTRSVAVTAQPQITFGVGEWTIDDRTITFRPQTALSPGTRYAIGVTGRDRAGNALTPFTWTFTATAPGARTGTWEARLKDRVEARADERLFMLFAALTAAGYDAGLKESGPVRDAVRGKLGELAIKVVEPFRTFRAEHAQPMEAYIGYVLSLTAPPELAEQQAPAGFEGLNRILAQFYNAAKIPDLWKAQTEAHEKAAAAFASAGIPVIGRVMDYLRVTEVPAGRIVLLPNLLDSPQEGYLVRQGEMAFFVVGSSGTLERTLLIRLAVKLILASMRFDAATELQQTQPLFALVKESAQKSGYGRWEEIVRESLVAAVTSHLAVPPAQQERFLRDQYQRGLILVDHFAAELLKYERVTIPLVEFFPQMLRSVNLDDERRRFAERKQ